MTVKEWRALLKKAALSSKRMAQPVDFANLEKRGIITKAGARYIVHDMHALPPHATEKIYEFGSHKKGLIVKFRKASKKKLTQHFEKALKELDAQHLSPGDQIRLVFR